MRTASSALLSATGPLWRKSCWSASRCIPSFTHSKRVKFQRHSAPTRSRPEGGGTGSGHTAEPTAAPERAALTQEGGAADAVLQAGQAAREVRRPHIHGCRGGSTLRSGEAVPHHAPPRHARWAAGPAQARAGAYRPERRAAVLLGLEGGAMGCKRTTRHG